MLKKIFSLATLLVFSFTLTACNDKGKDFVGHWKEINAENPYELDIRYDDGIFHVDVDEYSIPRAGYIKTKFESKAESNSVLTSNGRRQMRFVNGTLDYESREFQKTK